MGHETAKKTLLITGGAGFIGSHLADAFLADGHRVIILDDLSSGREENIPQKAEFHLLDIRSEEAARLVETAGIDVMVHQAAKINVRQSMQDPRVDADVNIIGSINLIEAARKGGAQQILFASTGGAIYGEQDSFPAPESHPTYPISHYGVSKLAMERYLSTYHKSYGLDVVCLRYANVYGERQNPFGDAGVIAIFLEHLLEGRRPTIHGDGSQTRDYIHISSVIEANRRALGRKGFAIYNVGTGIETSVLELYHHIARAVGSELEPIFGPAKRGDQSRSSINPARIQHDLHLAAPIPLEEGLARTAAWFREHRWVRDAVSSSTPA